MNRRELLRLLSQATALALFAFGAEGCGGGTKSSDPNNNPNNNPNNDPKGNPMATNDERLDTVRRLLDDAVQKYQSVADPLTSAQLGTQIAIGNAVLVIADRVSYLSNLDNISREASSSAGSLSDINNHTRDIASAQQSIDRKT